MPRCNLHLHVDRAHLDALEGNRGDPLDHLSLIPRRFGASFRRGCGAGRDPQRLKRNHNG